MRITVAAALLAVSCGCAAARSDPSAAPESVAGPHRVRVAHAEWVESGEPGAPPLLALQLALVTDAEGVLLSRRPARAEVVAPDGTRVATEGLPPEGLGADTTLVLRGIRTGAPEGTLREVSLELTLLRVSKWTERERTGLMDASLDEEVWPPFHLRFMGEGESFWLTASMADRAEGMPAESEAVAEHLAFDFVTERATVRDSKGRDLFHYATSGTGGGAVASFAIHAPGGPVPVDPSIAYPATVRLRIPAKWEAETVRFVLRDLALPPRPGR